MICGPSGLVSYDVRGPIRDCSKAINAAFDWITTLILCCCLISRQVPGLKLREIETYSQTYRVK